MELILWYKSPKDGTCGSPFQRFPPSGTRQSGLVGAAQQVAELLDSDTFSPDDGFMLPTLVHCGALGEKHKPQRVGF